MSHIITVNSDGSVSPTKLEVDSSHSNATVKFQGATSSVKFTVSGLDSGQFDPTSSSADVNSFETTDTNNDSNEYSYSITVSGSGRTSPNTNGRIQNGSAN